ncbi:MAG: Type 1 glutamine amidotransferase-like domain-containing protein [Planctomycetota bacterium]
MQRHIVVGGSGYSGPIGGPSPILRYFLDLTGKRVPRVCYLPTAAADSQEGVNTFLHVMNGLGVQAGYLRLFNPPTWDLEGYLAEFDAILASGGHTRNMLALWREWELDRILTRAWKRGVVLGGASAGAICWYEEGCTDSVTDGFDPLYNGLGLIKGSHCPHYDHPRGRWRSAYLEMVRTGQLAAGYAVTNRAALHYINGKLAHKLGEAPDAAVYWVEKQADGKLIERKDEVQLLSGPALKLEPAAPVARRRAAQRKGKKKS